MKKWSLLLLICCVTMRAFAQPATQPAYKEIPLWPNGAPGAKGDAPTDRPIIAPFFSDHPNGTAIVVAPGGGYTHLAFDHEGIQVAKWLNSQGIHAFVLRYRYGPYQHPTPLGDGLRAMRYVRSHASDWKIDPTKIGVIGFSAGGHLASSVGTHFKTNPQPTDEIDKQNARPDFMILVYPVITMDKSFTHAGSRKSLLGENPDQQLVDLMSNEKQVTPETPPTFLIHSTTDKVVPVQNAQAFNDALQKAGVQSKLVIFNQGNHGYGLAAKDPELSTWPVTCIEWLKEIKMLPTNPHESSPMQK